MTQDSIIGVGIIGLGVRGLHSIARPMAETFPETKFLITALCDRNPLRMAEAGDFLRPLYGAHGVKFAPRNYTDGRDLIADPAVDLIVITSITDTHRQFAVPALYSGKKVYCDKPLAHNVADAAAIVEAEAAAGNPLIMGFTRRYERTWLKAYELLRADAIGPLAMIQVRNIIPYHRYLTAWWRRREWSGGALNDKGCHLFDVFNWFSGEHGRASARLRGAQYDSAGSDRPSSLLPLRPGVPFPSSSRRAAGRRHRPGYANAYRVFLAA
jgi:predicted dehydrogenase